MKTIDEKAKELFPDCNNESDQKTVEMFRQIFRKGAEFAQAFIPITERLPEEDQGFYKPVLVLVEQYGMCCSAAFKNSKFIPDNPIIEEHDITHWRPIELI